METMTELRLKCVEIAMSYATNVPDLLKQSRVLYDYIMFDSLPSVKKDVPEKLPE